MENKQDITINLDNIEKDLKLTICERTDNTLFISKDFTENLEAEHQLKEGCFYDFEFNNENYSFAKNIIVLPHTKNKHLGTLAPNIYVGTLQLELCKNNQQLQDFVTLEVQSIKTDYRTDYRKMLEYITEQCTELLFQIETPTFQNFDVNYDNETQSLYQKFMFIKSIILTEEFNEAINKIISAPVSRFKEESEYKNISNIKRFNHKHVKEFISSNNRFKLPENHHLLKYNINSVPFKINTTIKTDTVDIPENRFIKHVLEVFLDFTSKINYIAKNSKHNAIQQLEKESNFLQNTIESWLQHTIFKEISRPTMLKINSPILQRKEGYREVLRVWLMFDLAAKLIWSGGDDVYKAGKKDIAVLYEYWLFFKLIEILKTIFNVEQNSLNNLIVKTDNGLNLTLKQGTHQVLEGTYTSGNRKLNMRFHYNRTFSGNNKYTESNSGSWTITMRPDYTLTIWPSEIKEAQAEKEELIVHIHFDAKYKVENLKALFDTTDDSEKLLDEKNDNRKGNYKNIDLLKMHAYKDAIRRTGGAYVLYPGDGNQSFIGFHEIIPGLGAFAINPKLPESGTSEIKHFINEVIDHFCNRASQRERIAYKLYDVYKNKPNKLKESTPETYGNNRNLLPDETYVLVAYYKKEKLDWIKKHNLYNARTGETRGSLLHLGKEITIAKYILLHTGNEIICSELVKVIESENKVGPQVFSKSDLLKCKYPNPTQENYLVYTINQEIEPEFQNKHWDISKLDGYKSGRDSHLPFAVTLTQLMNALVKN